MTPGGGGGIEGPIDDDPFYVDFFGVLMPDGELQVTATASDNHGNTTVETIDLSVVSLSAYLEFLGLPEPELVFNTTNDAIPATAGLDANITVSTTAPFPGEMVYFCRLLPADERPGSADDECDDDYEQLGEPAALSGTEGFSLAVFYGVELPEGPQTFYAILPILDPEEGGTNPQTGLVTYLVDTTRPTVVWSAGASGND